MPTQFNSPIYEGNAPAIDASVVAVLRHAGALILGMLPGLIRYNLAEAH